MGDIAAVGGGRLGKAKSGGQTERSGRPETSNRKLRGLIKNERTKGGEIC